MGLIDKIAGGYSSNIIINNSLTWLPYDSWTRRVNEEINGKSGPVKTTAVDEIEIDRVLDELGVIRRDRGGNENTGSSSGNLSSSNNGNIHNVVKGKETKKRAKHSRKDITSC